MNADELRKKLIESDDPYLLNMATVLENRQLEILIKAFKKSTNKSPA